MRALLTSLLLCLLAGAVTAQTVDPGEFLPLGTFNQWLYTEVGDVLDTTLVQVKNTSIHRGVVRYLLEFPKLGSLRDASFLIGVDGGRAYLYAARVSSKLFDDDISVDRLEFTPPLLIADGTALDGPKLTSDVDTTIKVKKETRVKDITVEARVRGTVASRWRSRGGQTTPVGDFGAEDMATLDLTFELNFESKDKDYDFDKKLHEVASLELAKRVGPVRLDLDGDKSYVLSRAILPGRTLGEFPPVVPDVVKLAFDIPGLLSVNGNSGSEAADGFLRIYDLDLVQTLAGSVELLGMLDVLGSGAEPRKFKMTGKLKRGKLSLKGKFNHDGVGGKPIAMKVKTLLTAASTSFAIDYKGKDDLKVPFEGRLVVDVAPVVGDRVRIDLNPAVDRVLEPDPVKRLLGAEGTLAFGTAVFPVVFHETAKAKEGKPLARKYALTQTGTDKSVVKWKATSTSALDFALGSLVARILGAKAKPGPGTIDLTVR